MMMMMLMMMTGHLPREGIPCTHHDENDGDHDDDDGDHDDDGGEVLSVPVVSAAHFTVEESPWERSRLQHSPE